MSTIKQVQIGTGSPYDISAKYILDNSATPVEKSWTDIVSLVNTAKISFIVCSTAANTPKGVTFTPKGSSTSITGTLEAASGTTTAFYLVYHNAGGKDEYDEYVTTGTAWEKLGNTDIDLTGYMAIGTNYSAAAKSNGAHEHTVTVPTVSKDSSKKLVASASGTAVGADGTASAVTAAIKSAALKSSSTTGTGYVTYTEDISGSAPALGGTVTFVKTQGTLSGGSASGTFVTSAIKSASLDVKSSSTIGYQAIVAAQGTLSGGSATGTFNTDAIKDITLSASETSTDGPAYLSDVTHTAATLTGTKTFNTDAMKASVTDGVLKLEAAGTGTVGISGGSITKTTKYMKHTNTNASTGSVSYTAPTLGAATTKYINVVTAAADTDSVSYTAPTLGAATTGTVTISGGSYSATKKYAYVETAAADSKETVLKGVKVTAQPTVTISESTTSGTVINEHITISSTSATTSNTGAHTHDVQASS